MALKGAAELYANLQRIPLQMEKKLMRGGLRSCMNIEVRPQAKAGVQSVSGQLAAGLRVGTRLRNGFVIARLYTTGPHGFIGKFVEYGTKPHYISVAEDEKQINVRRSGKMGKIVRESMTTLNRRVRSMVIRQRFVGPTVWHPGASPKAFMRPALDAAPDRVLARLADYLRTRLTKEGLSGPDETDVVI